ncbi:hypothetical protein BRC81_03430 [Halobacteriales archaeon QS_1_68_20]|nr:MAG: hypothetical protein BRC81_03430 [Halobacteriales archaeon QS_1_68_20]
MSTDRSHGAARDSNSAKLSARLSPRLLSRVAAAVEDGPYHSRSHLVRTALHLLLASPGGVRDGRGAGGSEQSQSRTTPDGVHLASVREAFRPDGSGDAAVLTVEVRDGRNGDASGTHTFVYDADRFARTATLRTYDQPERLDHEQATSVGAVRALADAALDARNWRLSDPAGQEGRSRTGNDA